MTLIQSLRGWWLRQLSFPAQDRALYRAVWNSGPTRLLDIGVSNLQRAVRLIELAKLKNPLASIEFVGISLFEAARCLGKRSSSLKEVYQQMRRLNVVARLIPGTILPGLQTLADLNLKVDFVLIAGPHDCAELLQAWPSLMRLLDEKSQVWVHGDIEGRGTGKGFKRLSIEEIQARAFCATEPTRCAA